MENEEEIINKNPVEDRIKNLSKGKKEAEEKADTEAKARMEAEDRVKAAEKETSFYKDFSGSITKYPNAGEYQDVIKEKVMSGYSVEDATVSVLAREGKLNIPAPVVQRESPAGGSATNQIQNQGNKSLTEMTQADRRQAIIEAQNRGDIGLS